MAEHNDLGKLGEQLALQHLRSLNYQILEVNWYHGKHELDIIAMDGPVLVVVEVKTRATDAFGEPEYAVNRKKQRSIVKAADAFIQEHDLNLDTRFDVISVLVTPQGRKISHIDDAFYPIM